MMANKKSQSQGKASKGNNDFGAARSCTTGVCWDSPETTERTRRLESRSVRTGFVEIPSPSRSRLPVDLVSYYINHVS